MDAAESTVGHELVLVYGKPSRIAVLNRSGAVLWKSLAQGPVVTSAHSPEHGFFESLAELGLVGSSDAPSGAKPVRSDANLAAPALVHSGVVEVLVYGSSGSPSKPEVPPFGPTSEKTTPDWFSEPEEE